MSIGEFSDQVLFIIVVYRQHMKNCPAWKSLESEISSYGCKGNVLIYDNSPTSQTPALWPKIQLHYHHNPENPGVGVAYNFGKKIADESGKNWLFLLDQDTELPKGSLAKYVETIEKNPQALILAPIVVDQKGILSPFHYRGFVARRISAGLPDVLSLETHSAINSGLLIQTGAYQKAGGYDHSFPLDFSDIFFLRKFRKVSDKLYIVPTELHQNFSGATIGGLADALNRYSIYSKAAQAMGILTGHKKRFWFRSLIRAIHLASTYRRITFITFHFKIWRHE